MHNFFPAPTAFAVVFTLLGGLAAPPSLAVPFQERKQANCSASSCAVDFDVVPASKRLDITSVSCLYTAQPASSRVLVAGFRVFRSGGVELLQDFVVPVFLGTSSGLSFTQANNQTFFFVRAGGKVRADFNTLDAASTFLECKIAGNLVPL
jgi:hypothetical protein